MNTENLYESDELLHQYLIFHYASAEEQFPYPFGGSDALDFPKRCALFLGSFFSEQKKSLHRAFSPAGWLHSGQTDRTAPRPSL